MPKYTTPEDIILRLRTALETADRKLELVLAANGQKEWGYAGTVCYSTRRILRSAIRDCFEVPGSAREQEQPQEQEQRTTPGTIDLQAIRFKVKR